MTDRKRFLEPFIAPAWCKSMEQIPKYKVKLCISPTEIHRFTIPDIPKGYTLDIKRDDETGCVLTGNKVRPLEFLLADAIEQDCSHVITCGLMQSNNCRVAALAAKRLGLISHLLLGANTPEAASDGNVLLTRMIGAHIYLVDKMEKRHPDLLHRMEKLSQFIKEQYNEKSYIIPFGSLSTVGVFGYLTAFEELLQQNVGQNYDDLVVACGSGGTLAGLAIGNYLCGSLLRVHGFPVCENAEYFYKCINEIANELGLSNFQSKDLVDIIDGYLGLGYGISSEEELKYLITVGESSGIVLEAIYCGKAVKGLIQELNKNPGRFKGKRILFIHTGGIFSLYDGKIAPILKQVESSNRIYNWLDKNKAPPLTIKKKL